MMRQLVLTGAALALVGTGSMAWAASGEGSVSGGSATYDLPIAIPAGDESVEPSVSLTYSSKAGNGVAGMGWTLSAGVSSIGRCPKSIEFDGYTSSVSYSGTDRLCIDGERLVVVDGEYGKDGSVYGTRTDHGTAVALYGDINDPHARFATLDGHGAIGFYDKAVIPAGSNAALTWLRTTWRDADGRSIQYFYDTAAWGETTLAEIRYTGRATKEESRVGDRFVRFRYSQRPDVSSTFIAGGESRQSRVLTGVVTGTDVDNGNSVPSSEYSLDYQESKSSGRLLLRQIVGCTLLPGRRLCSRPTTVRWLDSAIVFAKPEPVDAAIPGSNLSEPWFPGAPLPILAGFNASTDYDADGLGDLLAHGTDGSANAVFLETGHGKIRQISIPDTPAFHRARWDRRFWADLRHLGASDIVGNDHGSVAVRSWHIDGFTVPQRVAVPYAEDMVIFDVSGDGIPDILQGRKQAADYQLVLYRNIGTSPDAMAFGPAEVVAVIPDNRDLWLEERTDLTNSGRAVLVHSGKNIERIVEFDSVPGGALQTSVKTPLEFGIDPEALAEGFVLADINGDGQADLVYVAGGTWRTQMNADAGFAPAMDTGHKDERSSAISRAGTVVFDYDSDGKDELLFPARRVSDYCLDIRRPAPLCSEELGGIEPRMDLGIYEFDAIDFSMDPAGHVQTEHRSDLGLVAQANRLDGDDLGADGYIDMFSPFDRGVQNGFFRGADGRRSECPQGYGCGLHLMSPVHVREDRRDAVLDTAKSIANDAGEEWRWSYYALANPARHLYSAPALDSPERFLDSARFYFTSSMFVVGDYEASSPHGTARSRFEYGGAVYNTQGLGFDGFTWIVQHDESKHAKYGAWFNMQFPYRALLGRSWTEKESDTENDYLHGSPGREYQSFEKITMHCYGPAGHPVTVKFGCTPTDLPLFRVVTDEQ